MKRAATYRLAIAVRYWHADRLIIENQAHEAEHWEPVGYLLSMAAEIAIKAYLVEKGVSDERLQRRFGHDLRKCLSHAVQEGLCIDDYEASCVLNMRTAHMSHFNRYGPSARDGKLKLGAFLVTDEKLALDAIARLIDRVNVSANHRPLTGGLIEDWPTTPPLERPITIERLTELNAAVDEENSKIEKMNHSVGGARRK